MSISQYQIELKELNAHRCDTCHGIGKCNDAEGGDIGYNEWECPACYGTGKKPEQKSD